MEARFQGRVAVVTGAGSGVGRATALRLAREGASVALIDVNAASLKDVAAEIAAIGAPAEAISGDVSDPGFGRPLMDRVADRFGRIDLLCNIAGVAQMHHATEITPDDWHRVISINLGGVFFLAQAAIPHLLKADGVIVNVASSAGIQGQAYMAPYCASKAGVAGLTRALAMEFMHQPIRIVAVAPAGISTPLAKGTVPPVGAERDLLMRYKGMRPHAEPEDVAAFILFVASDEGRRFHGATLSMDQGQTAG